MPKERRFTRLLRKESDKIAYLLSCLNSSVQEANNCVRNGSKAPKTTVLGVAQQFGGNYRIRRVDYDLIKDMTISEIIEYYDKILADKKENPDKYEENNA